MRALYVPVILLAGIFALTMMNSRYFSDQTTQWLTELSKIDIAADNEDWDTAAEITQQVYNSWLREQFYLHIVIHHTELDQAEALFQQLLVICDEKDAVEARLHLADLRSQIQLLAEMEELSITNIL